MERINWKYKSGLWKPILLLHENYPPLTLMALRCMADFCIVSSLHDGMNLVAKEYVASRYDEEGVVNSQHFCLELPGNVTDALLGQSLRYRSICRSHPDSPRNAGC